jgi:tetratricopeptide (TPR) repeat protein
MYKLLDLENPVELTGALGLGVSLRMLQKSPDAESYSIHRLLSEVRREEIPLDERKEWTSQICKRVGDWFQARRRDFSNLPMLEAEIDHLRAWQELSPNYAPEQTSRLIWLESYPPQHRGRYGEAKALIEEALTLFEQIQTEDNELKANLLHDLGRCYQYLLKLQVSLNYYDKALEIRQRVFGYFHADTADSFNDIATAYSELGEHTHGLENNKRALEIRLKVLGERNQDVARSYNNISTSYGRLRNYIQAMEYAEKSLNLFLEVQGEKHPGIAYALNSVGSIYSDMRRSKQAQEYCQKGLKLFRELLGDQHRDTILAAANTANILCNFGRSHQGLQLLEEMLRRVQQDNPRYSWLKQEALRVRNLVPGLLHLPASSQRHKKKKRKKH